MQMTLITLLSLSFWSLYKKLDDDKFEYTQHPFRTIVYYLASCLVLIFLFPKVLYLFYPDFGLLLFIGVMWLAFFMFKILKALFVGPNTSEEKYKYIKLLDRNYIWPKTAEIIFQQTFVGSMYLLLYQYFGYDFKTFIILILFFVLAHIPLFFLQGVNIGSYYLFWSIVGAPIFVIFLVLTGSLWYTISIHVLFYIFLAIFAWIFTGTNFRKS